MARGSAGESVLHKHLRILDTFDAWHPYLALSEIADAAGLARSTAHRLIAELEREGLVERLPDRTYRLGVRLWEFASRTPGAIGLREIARPWLGAVHERIRQHVQLGVLAGRDVLFVERMSARDAVVNATLIGGRIPLHASSSGLVLLAHAPSTLVDDVARHGMKVYTHRTIRTAEELRDRVRHVRAAGVAVTEGYIHLESRGIAVPVSGPDGSVYAALGVVVPDDGAPTQPIVEVLRRAAAGVTRDLLQAYRPEPAAGTRGIRSLAGTSRRSLEYLESLPPAEREPHEVGGGGLG
ncbi:IclR family transcriptional regulator [Microbacterium sp. LRZ72]|uniref:IclR family transcriptional regulator n=1 Tax=Microbacterium sp. LRZ72 TaxID=2942481 RepID=UPI0029A5D544|nr:IclR family transcriptional regulator [Microbacterium sp. LRZ72]MDX2376940.1 IclR family transcriptional regulator [Microbacterium sp. LRZ72]